LHITTDPWEVILDVLPYKIKAEEHRSHDPIIHHWLATDGFQNLLTDFCTLAVGTALANNTTLPTPARVDYNEAKKYWESYFRGHMSPKEIFNKYGKKVVLVVPDRQETMPRVLAKVQKDIFELYMEEDKAMS